MTEQAFCASCFSPVDDSLDVCGNCGGTLTATPDPKRKTVHPEGHSRKRRTSPSLLIVIGMWLVLLPGLVIAFEMLLEPTDARLRISVLVGLVFWLYGTVLNRVTRRYFESKRLPG